MIKKTKYAITAVALCVTSSIIMSGCRTVPSADVVYQASEAIGRTAGFAVELSKTKQEVKDGMLYVLDVLTATVPATNETFVAKWMPIAEAEIQNLIQSGKISKADGVIISHASYVVCEGIDLVFVKYPVAKQYKELTSAAVDGFTRGFKSVVTSYLTSATEFDAETYNYLKRKLDARRSL